MKTLLWTLVAGSWFLVGWMAPDLAVAQETGRQGSEEGASPVDWRNPKRSEEYVIRGVRRQNVPGYIKTKGGWEWQLKCIEARLEYRGSQSAASGNVRAYFYNREGKLIDQVNKPPRRQDKDRKYVTVPDLFQKGKTVEVYYPITNFHETSGLATVLIVFGSGEDFAVESMPKTSLEPLAFEEKKHLFPGWTPDDSEEAGEGKAPSGALSGELEIRRLREEKHPYAVTFDGRYRNGMPCLVAEVRAKGRVTSPGRGVVKLYVFDETGKQVAFRRGPSSASVGGGSYLGAPQIADESWHPVFFSLDGDLKEKKYPTHLLVFQFGGKTAAMVKSSAGATVESLDFPEKGALKAAP